MGIEDLATIGKVSKTADVAQAARAAKVVDEAANLIVEFRGTRYQFPPGTDPEQAKRVLWNKVVKPQTQKSEEVIDLPSELPPERQKELDDLAAAKTELEGKVSTLEATILEFKQKRDPAKLSPGIYQDEDTGKYFQIDKEGNMKELTDNETP